MLKFQKFYVSNGEIKARGFYSLDNRVDGRRAVLFEDHPHYTAARARAESIYNN